MVDIQRNADVQKAIARAWTTNKLVTAVCHGPCALLGVDLGDGTPFVRGKKLTSFSKNEENSTTPARTFLTSLRMRYARKAPEYSSAANWHTACSR